MDVSNQMKVAIMETNEILMDYIKILMLKILYCLNIGTGNKTVLLENECATC